MIHPYLCVGLGGAIGAICRLFLTRILPPHLCGLPLPVLFINSLGGFFMGMLVSWMASRGSVSPSLRFFFGPGFLGGFTTFSAFTADLSLLLHNQNYLTALVSGALNVLLSLLAFWGGSKLLCVFR